MCCGEAGEKKKRARGARWEGVTKSQKKAKIIRGRLKSDDFDWRDLAELFREDGSFRYAVYVSSRCNLSISFLHSDMPRPFNFVVFVLSARF